MSFQSLGQPANTAAGAVANQPTGVSAAITNLAAGAEGTFTLTNSLITANSIILAILYNQGGDTTANVSMTVDIRSVAAGSAVAHVRNNGSGNAAGTWVIWYFVIN